MSLCRYLSCRPLVWRCTAANVRPADAKEPSPAVAEWDLKWWCGWVGRLRTPEIKNAAKTLRNHWDGVVACLRTHVTNGAAEASNGIIQTVKRKARGFRSVEYFSAIIYLVAFHLKFDLPRSNPSYPHKGILRQIFKAIAG